MSTSRTVPQELSLDHRQPGAGHHWHGGLLHADVHIAYERAHPRRLAPTPPRGSRPATSRMRSAREVAGTARAKWTSEQIDAQTALQGGVVRELVTHDRALNGGIETARWLADPMGSSTRLLCGARRLGSERGDPVRGVRGPARGGHRGAARASVGAFRGLPCGLATVAVEAHSDSAQAGPLAAASIARRHGPSSPPLRQLSMTRNRCSRQLGGYTGFDSAALVRLR
jgi:hypothetical protein